MERQEKYVLYIVTGINVQHYNTARRTKYKGLQTLAWWQRKGGGWKKVYRKANQRQRRGWKRLKFGTTNETEGKNKGRPVTGHQGPIGGVEV
jgi:hypothetical protein